MTELPPPELAALFDAERAAPAASAAARTAMRARLVAAVAHVPLGAAAAAGLGAAGKTLAVIALAVGVGAGTVAVVKHRDAATPAAVIAAPPPPATVTVTPLPPPTEAAPAAVEPVPPPAKPRAVPSQATLVEQAWSEITAGDPARALDLVREDERAHPDGALREEREAIDVVALAKLHRLADARAAAARFADRYPDSVHRALIARVLEPETTP